MVFYATFNNISVISWREASSKSGIKLSVFNYKTLGWKHGFEVRFLFTCIYDLLTILLVWFLFILATFYLNACAKPVKLASMYLWVSGIDKPVKLAGMYLWVRGIDKPVKLAGMYLWVRGIDFVSFYDFSVGFWSCFYRIVFHNIIMSNFLQWTFGGIKPIKPSSVTSRDRTFIGDITRQSYKFAFNIYKNVSNSTCTTRWKFISSFSWMIIFFQLMLVILSFLYLFNFADHGKKIRILIYSYSYKLIIYRACNMMFCTNMNKICITTFFIYNNIDLNSIRLSEETF
jgi:hypothetical protein